MYAGAILGKQSLFSHPCCARPSGIPFLVHFKVFCLTSMTDPGLGSSLNVCEINCPPVCSSWMDRTDKTVVTCGKVTQEVLSRETCLKTARTGLQIRAKPRVTWVTVF